MVNGMSFHSHTLMASKRSSFQRIKEAQTKVKAGHGCGLDHPRQIANRFPPHPTQCVIKRRMVRVLSRLSMGNSILNASPESSQCFSVIVTTLNSNPMRQRGIFRRSYMP